MKKFALIVAVASAASAPSDFHLYGQEESRDGEQPISFQTKREWDMKMCVTDTLSTVTSLNYTADVHLDFQTKLFYLTGTIAKMSGYSVFPNLSPPPSTGPPHNVKIALPNVARWTPVMCDQLNDSYELVRDLQLEKVNKRRASNRRSLLSGAVGRKDVLPEEFPRNFIHIVRERRTNKYYIRKAFGDAIHYSNELAFATVAQGHPNIINYRCVGTFEGHPAIIMEYPVSMFVQPNDVISAEEFFSSYLATANHAERREALQSFVAQLLDVNVYLHGLGFVWGDIASPNILIQFITDHDASVLHLPRMNPQGSIISFRVVAIDFETSSRVQFRDAFSGHSNTIAPECVGLAQGNCGFPATFWEIGVTLLELLHRMYAQSLPTPQREKAMSYVPLLFSHDLQRYVVTPPIESIKFSQDLGWLLLALLQLTPSERAYCSPEHMSFLQAAKFFEGFDWSTQMGHKLSDQIGVLRFRYFPITEQAMQIQQNIMYVSNGFSEHPIPETIQTASELFGIKFGAPVYSGPTPFFLEEASEEQIFNQPNQEERKVAYFSSPI